MCHTNFLLLQRLFPIQSYGQCIRGTTGDVFDEQENGSMDEAVPKLNNSLYGLIQAPLSWYNHFQRGLNYIDFKVSNIDPGMYYGSSMILITYMYYTLFFGPELNAIEQIITEPEALIYGLNREKEDGSTDFSFLGVSILLYPVTNMLKMIKKD